MSLVTVGGGRRICFAEFGLGRGHPVIALHGTPGSRIKYAVAHETAARLGLRLVCPDRWGYGRSDAHPRPSLAAYADDVEALADRLGLGTFSLVAISGGSPFAVAAAAALKERVARLALVSPMGPMTPDVAMRPFHYFCLRLLPRVPGATTALFRFYRRLLLLAPGPALRLASVATIKVDKDLLRTPQVYDHLAETLRVGLAERAAGPAIDLKIFARPWDVSLQGITAPARVWLGTEDRNVPQAAARRLAQQIPTARLSLLPGQGHLWISCHYAEVLEWVADGTAGAGRTPVAAASGT